jgi:hypothetical protein
MLKTYFHVVPHDFLRQIVFEKKFPSPNVKNNHKLLFFLFLYAFMNPDTAMLLPIAYYA